ncbi:MAG TPA: GyrI-like domain-containing protein [Candidatus Limnocylindrales bacterium]|nr:GyrI-like domain-containing protein [Candidatus Limnocylindrales bacterium]
MTVAAARPETYPKRGEVRIRDVPPRRIIEVKGVGGPGSEAFQAAISALYTVAYGVHFALKRRGVDERVGALEGLWTFDRDPFASNWPDGADAAERPDPDAWQWSLLIELPATATDDEVEAAIDDGRRRHPEAALDRLREVWFEEGEVVEALHVGPYATEPETIARMSAVAEAAGRKPMGPHHEIYLGDPRRAAPERLRTVLREPVCPDEAPAPKAQPRETRPR